MVRFPTCVQFIGDPVELCALLFEQTKEDVIGLATIQTSFAHVVPPSVF